jgi:undecaprenyl-diphosphatase
MSDLLQAILLGILQGLTEFLPVSSSGHLELFKYFLGFEPESSLMFTVVVHFATALSTLVVFRKDVWEILRKIRQKEERNFTFMIVISMIPAALVGVFLEDWIDVLFQEQIILVSILLLVTGLLLFYTDKQINNTGDVTFKKAFIIGIAQAIAILPGISRSGATIATSVFLKIDRQKAARFSFLMVVPLIFGKMCKDLIGGDFGSMNGDMSLLIAGFVSAFIVGMIACTWMIKLVVKARLRYFGYYCFGLAVFAMVYYIQVG